MEVRLEEGLVVEESAAGAMVKEDLVMAGVGSGSAASVGAGLAEGLAVVKSAAGVMVEEDLVMAGVGSDLVEVDLETVRLVAVIPGVVGSAMVDLEWEMQVEVQLAETGEGFQHSE